MGENVFRGLKNYVFIPPVVVEEVLKVENETN